MDCSAIRCGALQPAVTFAKARTEVGVALSAKKMRTHWEVCAEGKQERDQWGADNEAMVQGNEKEAAKFKGKADEIIADKVSKEVNFKEVLEKSQVELGNVENSDEP